jgi:hypothetical protein
MRTLTCVEMACVSGGASGSGAINDMGGDVIFTLGAAGLLVSIPVIVGGAILGVPTLGLGFIAIDRRDRRDGNLRCVYDPGDCSVGERIKYHHRRHALINNNASKLNPARRWVFCCQEQA